MVTLGEPWEGTALPEGTTPRTQTAARQRQTENASGCNGPLGLRLRKKPKIGLLVAVQVADVCVHGPMRYHMAPEPCGRVSGVAPQLLVVFVGAALEPCGGASGTTRCSRAGEANHPSLDVKIERFACLGNSEGGVNFCGDNASHAISHPLFLSFALQLASHC